MNMSEKTEQNELIKSAMTLDRENRLELINRWQNVASVHRDSIERFEKRGSLISAEHSRALLKEYEEAIAELTALTDNE